MEKDIMLEDVKINFDIYLRALETALRTQKREDIVYSCLKYGSFVELKNKYLDLYGTIDDIDFLQKIYNEIYME